jgi:aspartyl-tRNA(Asn)/glutamyl-tRNA(Gln) amidotransferase subunit A
MCLWSRTLLPLARPTWCWTPWTRPSARPSRRPDKLAAAGAVIVEAEVPAFNALAAINAKGGFTAAEAYAWHRALIAENAAGYDQRVVSRARQGHAADLLDAARPSALDRPVAQLAGYDVLVMPTVPVAPRIAELQASDDAYYAANGKILRNPTLINFLDGCAVCPAMRRAAPRSGCRAGSGRR